jgi:hypothetical protein
MICGSVFGCCGSGTGVTAMGFVIRRERLFLFLCAPASTKQSERESKRARTNVIGRANLWRITKTSKSAIPDRQKTITNDAATHPAGCMKLFTRPALRQVPPKSKDEG